MASLSFSPSSGTIPANSTTTFKVTVSNHGFSTLGGNIYLNVGGTTVDATISGSTASCSVNPYSLLGSSCGGKTITWDSDSYFYDGDDMWYSDWIYLKDHSLPTYTIAQSVTVTINTFTVTQQNDGTVKFTCKATGKNGSGNITYTIKTGSTTLHSFTGASGSTITKTTDIASSLSYGTSYTFTLTAAYSTASSVTKSVTTTFIETSACSPPTSCVVDPELSYTAVDLIWSGAEDGIGNTVVGYNIQYCDSPDNATWGDWSESISAADSPLAVSPPDTAGYYRKYRIQTCGSAGEAYYSAWLESSNTVRKDMAPFEGFTDPELIVSSTKIKAIHMTEMQNRINDLLSFSGKETFSFSEIYAGETRLSGWTSHVTEIRNAIDALGRTHDEWLDIPENKPRVDVMMQMRDVVIGYSRVMISVIGEDEDLNGCIVTVSNADDGSTIAEFEYNEPLTIKIAPGIVWQISCSPLDNYVITPSYGPHTAEICTDVSVELCYRNAKRYGFKREKANSDPAARITYLYDAEGMTPLTMDLSSGTPDYGDWQTFVDEVCRPVMLKTDGTVDYELDHNDQTLKLDGTTSDIANTAYDGNAMVEFRKYKWVHRSEDDTYEYVIFSDAQWDDTYSAYSFTDANGGISDAFYWGMFKGSVVDSKLRSLGTGTVQTGSTTEVQLGYAQANGAGYYISYKSGWDYINDLLTLLSCNDCSDVYGNGRIDASSQLPAGTTRSNGAFYGSSGVTADVKVLYVEGVWGNVAERMAGLIYSPNKGFLTAMTPPYNLTGDGYYETGIIASGTSGGYTSESSCTDLGGWLPKATNGTKSTYFGDGFWYSSSIVGYARVGGGSTNDALGGARACVMSQAHTYASQYGCARLTYIPNT